MYSKGFNNCYILLSNISQAFENTKFGAGELSLISFFALVFALIRVRKHWWDDITQGKQ